MLRHPSFPDILLHTDDRLESQLGRRIAERRTVHEWPLSCVQKLTLEGGSSFAYKSQLPPTVEPQFYRQASSPLLPGHRQLDAVGDCAFMLIDWIEAPSLHESINDPIDLVTRGREIVASIAAIAGDLPCYLDLGTAESWTLETATTLEKAATLVRDGRIRSIDAEDVWRVRSWASDPALVDRVTAGARLVNADLRSDQVLVTADGYRVLDWQRPVIAMPELDLVSLLLSEQIEPRLYVDPAADRVYWMMRLHWAVVAQHDLFGESAMPLFDDWAAQAVGRILS